jgi:mono/diheme cytochrome c family protein
VTNNLSTAPEEDVRAIALYTASLSHGKREAVAVPPVDLADEAARKHPQGAALFAGACAGCHGEGAPMLVHGRPSLSLVSAIAEKDPRNTLNAILQGIQAPTGARGPYMPAFADDLGDRQIVEIAAYLRSRFSQLPAWPNLDGAAAAARRAESEP